MRMPHSPPKIRMVGGSYIPLAASETWYRSSVWQRFGNADDDTTILTGGSEDEGSAAAAASAD